MCWTVAAPFWTTPFLPLPTPFRLSKVIFQIYPTSRRLGAYSLTRSGVLWNSWESFKLDSGRVCHRADSERRGNSLCSKAGVRTERHSF